MKKKVFIFIILLIVIVFLLNLFLNINRIDNITQTPQINSEPTGTSTCVDSDSYCKGKPNGTSCDYGKWCDEQGRICGGQSCVALGLGECIDNKCKLKK